MSGSTRSFPTVSQNDSGVSIAFFSDVVVCPSRCSIRKLFFSFRRCFQNTDSCRNTGLSFLKLGPSFQGIKLLEIKSLGAKYARSLPKNKIQKNFSASGTSCDDVMHNMTPVCKGQELSNLLHLGNNIRTGAALYTHIHTLWLVVHLKSSEVWGAQMIAKYVVELL